MPTIPEPALLLYLGGYWRANKICKELLLFSRLAVYVNKREICSVALHEYLSYLQKYSAKFLFILKVKSLIIDPLRKIIPEMLFDLFKKLTSFFKPVTAYRYFIKGELWIIILL